MDVDRLSVNTKKSENKGNHFRMNSRSASLYDCTLTKPSTPHTPSPCMPVPAERNLHHFHQACFGDSWCCNATTRSSDSTRRCLVVKHRSDRHGADTFEAHRGSDTLRYDPVDGTPSRRVLCWCGACRATAPNSSGDSTTVILVWCCFIKGPYKVF